MKKTAVSLMLVLCLSMLLHVSAAEGESGGYGGSLSISFRGSTYFIDSTGMLWSGAEEPEPVLSNVRAVDGIDWMTMALDHAGQLWSWGGNVNYNLGYPGYSGVPVVILSGIRDFALSYGCSLALGEDGGVWFWGQLPEAANGHQTYPARVMDGAKAVFAGGKYGFALLEDDSLWTWTWAWNDDTYRYDYTPLCVMKDASHMMGDYVLGTDGTLWRLEGDSPEALSAVKQLQDVSGIAAAGRYEPYLLALDADGVLQAISLNDPEAPPLTLAKDCATPVHAPALDEAYYINTARELCRISIAQSARPKVILRNVLYAESGGDMMLGCITEDGWLTLYRPEPTDLPEKEVVCKDMLLAPLADTAPGVPQSKDYVAPVTPNTEFHDIEGSWAEEAIVRWAGYGVVQGADGAFRPDDTITRAEFAAILNRIMGYTGSAADTFVDVPDGAWYEKDIRAACAAGILQGDGKGAMRPLDSITHEEAAVMVARAFSYEYIDQSRRGYDEAEQLNDISHWARSAVIGMLNDGRLPSRDGLLDFAGKEAITRAGVVALVDRQIGLYIHAPGLYRDATALEYYGGNVLIRANDVVLRDLSINGNVYLAPGIGTDSTSCTLRDVTVNETLYVNGYMQNLTLRDSSAAAIVADNASLTTLRLTGASEVANVTLHSLGRLGEEDLADGAQGFGSVLITGDRHSIDNLLIGDFDRVVNLAPDAKLDLRGTVGQYYPAVPATLLGQHTIAYTHPQGTVPPDLADWSFLGNVNGVYGFCQLDGTLYACSHWGFYRMDDTAGWTEVLTSDYMFDATVYQGKIYYYSLNSSGNYDICTFDGKTETRLPSQELQPSNFFEFQGALYGTAHEALLRMDENGLWQRVEGWPQGHRVHETHVSGDTLYVSAGIYIGGSDYGHKLDYIDGYLLTYDGEAFTQITQPMDDEIIGAIGTLGQRVFLGTTYNTYIYYKYEVVDGALVPLDNGLDDWTMARSFIQYGGNLYTGALDSGSPTAGLYWFDTATSRWRRTQLGAQRISPLFVCEGKLYAANETGDIYVTESK